uniref:Uncharacterized protein n=1 Tax=Panagrolaimus sp. JU765 TaxID=591449 RepID=A0AC34Q7G3_9BILA
MESENEYKVLAMPEKFIDSSDKTKYCFQLYEEFKKELIRNYVKKEENAPNDMSLMDKEAQSHYLKDVQVEFNTIIDGIQKLLDEEMAKRSDPNQSKVESNTEVITDQAPNSPSATEEKPSGKFCPGCFISPSDNFRQHLRNCRAFWRQYKNGVCSELYEKLTQDEDLEKNSENRLKQMIEKFYNEYGEKRQNEENNWFIYVLLYTNTNDISDKFSQRLVKMPNEHVKALRRAQEKIMKKAEKNEMIEKTVGIAYVGVHKSGNKLNIETATYRNKRPNLGKETKYGTYMILGNLTLEEAETAKIMIQFAMNPLVILNDKIGEYHATKVKSSNVKDFWKKAKNIGAALIIDVLQNI